MYCGLSWGWWMDFEEGAGLGRRIDGVTFQEVQRPVFWRVHCDGMSRDVESGRVFCRSRLGSGSGLFLFSFLGEMFVHDVGQFADEAREGEIRVMCPLPSCHLSPRRQSTLDQF